MRRRGRRPRSARCAAAWTCGQDFGRLIDLIQRGRWLDNIEACVLDEAEQMLAVGFEEDVERIMQEIPEQRQTFLFSATMPVWVKRVARSACATR